MKGCPVCAFHVFLHRALVGLPDETARPWASWVAMTLARCRRLLRRGRGSRRMSPALSCRHHPARARPQTAASGHFSYPAGKALVGLLPGQVVVLRIVNQDVCRRIAWRIHFVSDKLGFTK